ncbi:Zinc finger protein ush [Folsomia candida]|uniref:Zinc finger protein ush n=1 Tax=Folsomia candida TaxID=158441 RepID=A0A226F5J0_FOLCA|nr:Zinc finger protein ush [Folsomia candida]
MTCTFHLTKFHVNRDMGKIFIVAFLTKVGLRFHCSHKELEEERSEEGGGREGEKKVVDLEEPQDEESPGSQESNDSTSAPAPLEDDANCENSDRSTNHLTEPESTKDDIKIPIFSVKVKREGADLGRPDSKPRLRSQSRSSSDHLAEFPEVESASESGEGDGRRKRRRESESCISVSRRKSPELPESGDREMMNGGATLSSQQLLQGLPYLHLLPPSIRNDAARLLFMPPILPSELSGNMNVANGCVDSEKASGGETSRSGGKEGSKDEQLDVDAKGVESIGPRKRERESGDEDRELMTDESMEVSPDGGRIGFNESMDGNSNKVAKTGKLYACMYCSYSADKKVSLNRHMRMHSGSISVTSGQNNAGDDCVSGSGSTTPSSSNNIGLNKNLPEGVNALERYCGDCDIQFSSIKTFRVHKQHYCRTRHVLKTQQGPAGSPPGIPMKIHHQSSGEMGGGRTSLTPVRKSSGSPVPSDGSPTSTPGPMLSSHQQPFVVLPTNPLIVVPYCFIQAASILPFGNVLPSQNALIVLPNGSVQGLPFTSVQIPVPSPSQSLLSQPAFSSGGGVVLSGGGKGSIGSLSPTTTTNQSHSVFNDPKDILRKISCVSKAGYDSSGFIGYNSTNKNGSLDDLNTSQNNSDEIVQSENNTQMASYGSDEHSDKNPDEETMEEQRSEENDEGMPAIDLTLRKTRSIKEISGDEEKENREVCLRLQNQRGEQQQSGNSSYNTNDTNSGGVGKKSSQSSTITFTTDFHRDREREMCSPSERVSYGGGGGSGGSCGKRTPRPSSTSISSSCSTPPALCEPKVNGLVNRLSPVDQRDVGASANNKNHSHINMMSPSMMVGMGKGSMDFTSGLDMVKHGKLSSVGGDGKGKRGGKMGHIATQLPGGAILTTSGGGQTLTDLLIPNSPEFNEILAKISPQLLVNSARSSAGSPMALNPALLQALSQSDPEILIRMLDPTYLANLQQNIQLQQQHASGGGKRGYSKCVECDIVFYKHENYLVHKEHYCAARISNSSPNNNNGGSIKEMQSSRGGSKEVISSCISSCSSPAKSDADESQSSPVSAAVHRASSSTPNSQNQMSIKVPRKSTDSSSSDFFPLPVYEKTKSRSPQGISSSISISPVASPNERKQEKQQVQNFVGGQHPCMHCGVKYSTIDNLKAHQSFYCTKRRNGKDSISLEGDADELAVGNIKSEQDSVEGYGMSHSQPLSSNNKGLLQCGKCKLAIPDSQLTTHIKVCLGSNVTLPYGPGLPGLMTPATTTTLGGEGGNRTGWKCPCCDTYSPTVSQAQKHLECHTGIKAFKCLLCGYRGNTLRGMRTHIRTHFDRASRVSDLLEGEYMTCITANDVEHNVTTPTNKSFSSSSEPRRSLGSLVNHHPANSRQSAEKNKLNHSPPTTSGSVVTTTTTIASSPGSPPQELVPQDIKLFSTPEGSSSSIMEEKAENNNRAGNCTLCNYTSSYRGNIIKHMKSVHKISEEAADKILTDMSSIIKVHSTSELDDDYSSERSDRKLNLSPGGKNTHIKEADGAVSNNVSSSGMEVASHRRKNINGRGCGDRDEKSDVDCAERNCTSRSSSPEEDVDGLSTLQKKEKPCAVKYCKSCDIYFNHLSTFDAHRKSYCSATLNNKAAERAETPVQ